MTELCVRLETQDGTSVVHTIDGDAPFWIGREEDCQLVLGSRSVSRRHACIERGREAYCVRDTSVNGTRVDGVPLRAGARAIAPPTELQIGPYRLTIEETAKPTTVTATAAPGPAPAAPALAIDLVALRRRLHRALLDHMDLERFDRAAMRPDSLRSEVTSALERLCHALRAELPDAATRARLVAELSDEVLGLGPLEGLLADAAVSEIMVVDAATIFAERGGRIEPTALRFTDDDAVRAIIERIVTPLGRRIDESTPLVDARLADGSRVNAVIPPLARRGPCITIRKFSGAPIAFERLIQLGALDRRVARFLERAVKARRNIVVSGGTGSGKTTLLNVLSSAVPSDERIVTIEDAAELRLGQPHVVALEARPPNLEGRGEVSIRELVKNALRMRPDRILVGECRGGEALDMLQAMNTGHEGSMTTTHANSPKEAIARLETLCLMAGMDLPLAAIRAQLASSIHLLVQQTRFDDGMRCVSRVSEVRGLNDDDRVEVRDIFAFDRATKTFRPTGYVPDCAEVFQALGLSRDGELL